MKPDSDSAQIRIPPPMMLLASILAGASLQAIFPLSPMPGGAGRWIPASILISTGIGVILFCAGMFRRAKTAIEPWKTTSHIVKSGPYRWTRNPIYLSFVLIGMGVAFSLGNLWIALMQIPLIAVLTRSVILKEERYLEQKFGEEYRRYKREVRRWI